MSEKTQRRDAEQDRDRQRDSAREKPQHERDSSRVRAKLSLASGPRWRRARPGRSPLRRQGRPAFVERVFSIGISEGIRAVLDSALLHVLVACLARAASGSADGLHAGNNAA